jgi:hypothetical protein
MPSREKPVRPHPAIAFLLLDNREVTFDSGCSCLGMQLLILCRKSLVLEPFQSIAPTLFEGTSLCIALAKDLLKSWLMLVCRAKILEVKFNELDELRAPAC